MKDTPEPASDQVSRPAAGVDAKKIVRRFSDYFPLLDGEDEQEFDAFQLSCIKAVQPGDAIEEVWLMDFVNYTWEAMRLRRIKIELIRSNRQEAVLLILRDHDDNYLIAEETARRWSEGEEQSVEYVNNFFETHGLNEDAINARSFQHSLKDLERLERLIASYDFRRDKAVQGLEQRRELLARRAREFADSIQDAEYVEVPGGSGK